MKLVSHVLLLSVVGFLSNCVKDQWESAYLQDHTMVGSIYDTSSRRFISRRELLLGLGAFDLLLLGEKHDNKDHHRLQTIIIQQLLAEQKLGALGFEHLDHAQEKALGEWLKEDQHKSSPLGKAIGWSQGWDNFKHYEAMFQGAIAAEVPIHALNLKRADIKLVLEKKRPSHIAISDFQALVHLPELPKPFRDDLLKEIIEGHCGMLNERQAASMHTAQRIRDMYMSQRSIAMLKKGQLGVVVAGNGHVRRDWGMPFYLKSLAPSVNVGSIAFLEVQADFNPKKSDWLAALPYSFVWFTPAEDLSDPCDKFKGAWKKEKKN